MGNHVKVRTLEHGDEELWKRLGPFLCSRDVHKDLGGPIYSDERVTWFVATVGRETVGFCALRETKAAHWYDYSYVVPERRRQGVFAALSGARAAHCRSLQSLPVRAAVREARWKHYRKRGWRETSRRGAWIYCIMESK